MTQARAAAGVNDTVSLATNYEDNVPDCCCHGPGMSRVDTKGMKI